MTITDAPARARWPSKPFDPAQASLYHSPLADELVLHFGDRALPHYVDFIDAPGLRDAAVLVAEDDAGEESGEIVGIQVDLLIARAANVRPAWRALAEPDPSPEAVALLVADIGELFARCWTPPPIEE